MRFLTSGKVTDNFHVLGSSVYPIYLLDRPEQPIIFESGISCLGQVYVEAVRSILGDRQPAYLFLSHAHWDHAGAASYLKRAFPAMQIAASPLAAETLQRPGAVKVITQLNADGPRMVKFEDGFDDSRLIDEPFRIFAVDIALSDGQVVEIDDTTTVEVLATPGHTRDHLSFYLPAQKILIAVESGGYMTSSGQIEVEFVADYDGYEASIRRLARLPAEILCQGHNIVFVGREEIADFLTRSLQETVLYKNRIYEVLENEQGDIDRAIRKIKAERWDNVEGFKQDEYTYVLNLTAQVKHLASRLNKKESSPQ